MIGRKFQINPMNAIALSMAGLDLTLTEQIQRQVEI
jgi:hypothetical protein